MHTVKSEYIMLCFAFRDEKGSLLSECEVPVAKGSESPNSFLDQEYRRRFPLSGRRSRPVLLRVWPQPRTHNVPPRQHTHIRYTNTHKHKKLCLWVHFSTSLDGTLGLFTLLAWEIWFFISAHHKMISYFLLAFKADARETENWPSN